MTQFLNRMGGLEIGAEGRTLSGLAMPWDKPSVVQDRVGGAPYNEAFAPVSTDKTLMERTTFPVFAGHDHLSEPIGVVSFRRSDAEGGLVYDAPLSRTQRADNYLELAKDGAMRSVSVQFRPIKAVRRTFPDVNAPVTYRTEVGLRHLALAPTGYGAYEDAKVLSIRTELDETVSGAVQAADAAIDAAAKCLDPTDDDYNVGQTQALITAAQLATDVALSMLGAVDADDAVDDGEADPSDPTTMLSNRMAFVYSTVARRRQVDRHALPDLV